MFVAGTRNQWDSEAKIKAHVHCVIIGFSIAPYNKPKKIFIDERYQIAKNINGYLLDAANVYVESRNKPICNILIYSRNPSLTNKYV